MCGLRTRPRTDVDSPRFLDRTAIGGGISSRRPRGDTLLRLLRPRRLVREQRLGLTTGRVRGEYRQLRQQAGRPAGAERVDDAADQRRVRRLPLLLPAVVRLQAVRHRRLPVGGRHLPARRAQPPPRTRRQTGQP